MTALIIIIVIILIGVVAIKATIADDESKSESKKAFMEESKKKLQQYEEEQKGTDEEVKRVMDARNKLAEEIAASKEEDETNAKQFRLSNLSHDTFKVKGLNYRSQNSQMGSLFLREYCTLHLEAEPDNEYDPFAVKVYSDNGNFWLGYVESGKSIRVSTMLPYVKSCFISKYEEGNPLPFITATVYYEFEESTETGPQTEQRRVTVTESWTKTIDGVDYDVVNFAVKGLFFRPKDDQDAACTLKVGDSLQMEHEEGNEKDKDAMKVTMMDGHHIGYVDSAYSHYVRSRLARLQKFVVSKITDDDIPFIYADAFFKKQ